jgi:hypothetical protein
MVPFVDAPFVPRSQRRPIPGDYDQSSSREIHRSSPSSLGSFSYVHRTSSQPCLRILEQRLYTSYTRGLSAARECMSDPSAYSFVLMQLPGRPIHFPMIERMSRCYRRPAICFIYIFFLGLILTSVPFFSHAPCIVLPPIFPKGFRGRLRTLEHYVASPDSTSCPVYPLCTTLISYVYSSLINPRCDFVQFPSIIPNSG